jgi:sulfur carrier protein ThiS
MRIKIIPMGIMKALVQPQTMVVNTGTTIGDLLRLLDIREKVTVIAIVDGQRRDPSASVSDGEEVKLLSLLSGG